MLAATFLKLFQDKKNDLRQQKVCGHLIRSICKACITVGFVYIKWIPQQVRIVLIFLLFWNLKKMELSKTYVISCHGAAYEEITSKNDLFCFLIYSFVWGKGFWLTAGRISSVRPLIINLTSTNSKTGPGLWSLLLLLLLLLTWYGQEEKN